MLDAIDYHVPMVDSKYHVRCVVCDSRIVDQIHFYQIVGKIPLIASIESPRALMRLGEIAPWRGRNLDLVGLLVSRHITYNSQLVG
jgi:hypothetical protein